MKAWQLSGIVLNAVAPDVWRIEPRGKMRVGVHLIGSQALLSRIKEDRSIPQAMNVATLPGVVDPVCTMPDIHQGYGFPIGGVAAFDSRTGVVSPGGVGYDINCGIRLLKTTLHREDFRRRATLNGFIQDLFENVPSGVGSKRQDLGLNRTDLDTLLSEGAQWALKRGFATEPDLDRIEERGRLAGADPEAVTLRAKERGLHQMGTLGSGNHFLELQYVDEVYEPQIAKVFGLSPNQMVLSIHTGSRGLGYQTCADYLDIALEAARRYGVELPDRELAACPIESKEGMSYLGAMAAAANFAFANRQIITHWVRGVLRKHFGARGEAELLYDVCHNIAKFEDFPDTHGTRRLLIHRKGATRAYPPKHTQVPALYREVGQPILVPGDMGRYSFILAGRKESMERSFGSACHGAGRELSRSQAKKRAQGRAVARELEDQGIALRAAGRATIVEEMPEAYKDVADVVRSVEQANIATPVCRLRPMGVVKG